MTKGKKSLKVLLFPLGKMSLVKQRVYLSFFVSAGLRGSDPAPPGQYRPMLFRMQALQMHRGGPADGQSGLETAVADPFSSQLCHP